MPSTITRFVEKLEVKKLVLRKNEGKNVILCATKDGLAMQQEILKAWSQLSHSYEGILTEEETRQFIEISSKLLKELED